MADTDDGLQDAAIFLMSLGEEEAAEVFKHFSPKEVQRLGETIARMRTKSRSCSPPLPTPSQYKRGSWVSTPGTPGNTSHQDCANFFCAGV